MNGLTAGMDTGSLGVTDKIKGMIQDQASGLKDEIAAADFGSLGQEIPNGVKEGVEGGGAAVGSAMIDMADKTKDAFKSSMDIHSPSRVFNEYGGFITTGLAEGVDEGANQPVNAMQSLSGEIRTPFNSLYSDFTYVGDMAMAGLNAGLNNGAGAVMSTAASIASRLKTLLRALWIFTVHPV